MHVRVFVTAAAYWRPLNPKTRVAVCELFSNYVLLSLSCKPSTQLVLFRLECKNNNNNNNINNNHKKQTKNTNITNNNKEIVSFHQLASGTLQSDVSSMRISEIGVHTSTNANKPIIIRGVICVLVFECVFVYCY